MLKGRNRLCIYIIATKTNDVFLLSIITSYTVGDDQRFLSMLSFNERCKVSALIKYVNSRREWVFLFKMFEEVSHFCFPSKPPSSLKSPGLARFRRYCSAKSRPSLR